MSTDTSEETTSPARKRSRWLWITLGVLLAILLLAIIGFIIWASAAPEPMPEALAALTSDASVAVTTGNPIAFTPATSQPTCGFIFYPGGKVDVRSYAPPLRAIAESGYLVLAPSMPLNLAVFAPNRAAELMAAYPEIKRWVVGGHSLGGAMAASFAQGNPEAVDGLVLWASFPAQSASLADQADLDALSVWGSLDGVASLETIQASAALLPKSARFVEIHGGNHAGFGWYGDQSGDNPATITRDEQQRQAVDATLELMARACAGDGE